MFYPLHGYTGVPFSWWNRNKLMGHFSISIIMNELVEQSLISEISSLITLDTLLACFFFSSVVNLTENFNG